MLEEELRIGLPIQGIIKYYIYSFLELLPSQEVKINSYDDHVKISSYNLIKVYTNAFKRIIDRIEKSKNIYKSLIPLSSNDNKIIKKVGEELGIAKADIYEMIQQYVKNLDNGKYSIVDLSNALYPFSIGTYSVPSVFNIEFYGFTRGAYFDGKYDFEYKLNLHTLMILIAGFINARCLRFRKKGESISVLIFPPSFNEVKDFVPKNKEEWISIQYLIENEAQKQAITSIYPIEAFILWLLINLPEEVTSTVNLYLVAISEPAGVNPASPMTDFFIPMRTLSLLMEDFLKGLKDREDYKEKLNEYLLKPALRYGILKKEKEDQLYEEEAMRYVKLLFVASQKNRLSERIELLNLSSRKYLLLLKKSTIKESEEKLAKLHSMMSHIAGKLIKSY